MKRGHKKLLIFQLIMFFILILNSFIHNILGNYSTIIFLVLTIIIFKFLFGIEKDRHRFTKDIIFDIIIFLLVFFLLYYLSGIIIGFARTDNYYNYTGFTTFIIPIIATSQIIPKIVHPKGLASFINTQKAKGVAQPAINKKIEQ